jgi:hypothetical protein
MAGTWDARACALTKLARPSTKWECICCRSSGGQGFAREASEAIIPYAFGRLGAAAIFAGHHPQNAASGRLLVKLGFTYQGDKLYIPTGLMHPTYLLRKEQAVST